MEYFLLELIHKSFVDDKYTCDALNEVFPFVTIMIHIWTASDLFQVWQKWPSTPQTCADKTGEMRKEF